MDIRPIKERPFPKEPAGLEKAEEPLVDLAQFLHGRLQVAMQYSQQNIPGAVANALLRLSAAKRLQSALDLLPQGYGLLIYDAWRPIAVQQVLFDTYAVQLRTQTAEELTDAQLLERVKKFVSEPSYDPLRPSVHNTGGAVDLTLTGPDGTPLDMGTGFDDFTPKAYTAAFETNGNRAVRDNRRLLYACMTQAGFTNLPTEWWHFDYGTAFWSYYTGHPAMYTGILKEDPLA